MDSLNRRLPNERPRPLTQRIVIEQGEADIGALAALGLHGPLTAGLMFPFTNRKGYNAFQQRLGLLYNGSRTNGPFVIRPGDYNFKSWRTDRRIYELHANAKPLLEEVGRPIIDRTDHAYHRFMGSCISASTELLHRANGAGYVSQHTILTKFGSALRIELKSHYLEPDGIFGSDFGDKVFHFYMREDDRGNEMINARESGKKSIESMLYGYLEALSTKAYEVWGIYKSPLHVLIGTTGAGRVDTIKKKLAECIKKGGYSPKLADRFLFKAFPMFGENWKPPKDPLEVNEWERMDGTPFYIIPQ